MKQRIITLLLVCILNPTTFDAKNYWQPIDENYQKFIGTPDDPPELTFIELLGKLDINAGPNDITAWVESSTVRVSFSRSFGYVSVKLYSPSSVLIHSSVVDTSVQSLVVIPFYSSTNGTYTLVLENANGYVEGDFEE